jgi:RNA polymerase sigma-70 factor (ECF subfamily)
MSKFSAGDASYRYETSANELTMPLPQPGTALIAAIRTAAPQANEQVYHLYAPAVRQFCERLLGGRQEVDDCVQNTFLKVCSEMRGLDRVEALPAWILTIARNEVYSIFRNRRGHLQLDDAADGVWDPDTPHQRMENAELRDAVAASLAELLPAYREVLILREMDQYSYAEIAAITNSTVSAVESRLFKARRALARRLAPMIHERNSS